MTDPSPGWAGLAQTGDSKSSEALLVGRGLQSKRLPGGGGVQTLDPGRWKVKGGLTSTALSERCLGTQKL